MYDYKNTEAPRNNVECELGTYRIKITKCAAGTSQMGKTFASVGFEVLDSKGDGAAAVGDERTATTTLHPQWKTYYVGFRKSLMMALEGLTEREFNELPEAEIRKIDTAVWDPPKGKESAAIDREVTLYVTPRVNKAGEQRTAHAFGMV